MLKFVLRIFVVLAIGFVLSNEVVDRAANYLFESETANYTREAVRGQLHSLKQELAHVPPDARPGYVRNTLAPHYGLALKVAAAGSYGADRIADLEPLHRRADRADPADDLVARHHRVTRATPVVADLVQVRVADAAVQDVDGHVVGAQRAAVDRQRLQGRAGGKGGVGKRAHGAVFQLNRRQL